MKKILFLVVALFSFSALACLETHPHSKICPGDTVFPDTYTHPKGGKVLAINPALQTVTVHSHHTGAVERFAVADISLSSVCLNRSCSGSTVYPDSFYHTDGAWVLAANPFTKKITVVAHTTGGVSRISKKEYSVGRGCLRGVCVKDVVFPDDYTNSRGARVIAVNPYTNRVTVVSIHTGLIERYLPLALSVTDYCVDYTAVMRNYEVYTDDVIVE